jgi:hypothetical protein
MFGDQGACGGGDDGGYGRLEPDACDAGNFVRVSGEPKKDEDEEDGDVVSMSTRVVRR